MLNRLFLEVCSACQNTCKFCAHAEMRETDPGFQLDLDDMERLIKRLRDTNCRIDEINIHGPGEPLLWKNFNPGIRAIKQSGITNRVTIVTNGILLGRIDPDVWEHLGTLRGQRAPVLISRYPGLEIDTSAIESHRNLCEMLDHRKFWDTTMHQPASKVYSCACPGPSYYKGKVYPHCGPPLFSAAAHARIDPFEFGVELDQWNPNKPYNLRPPCVWCWANTNKDHVPDTVDHEFLEPPRR